MDYMSILVPVLTSGVFTLIGVIVGGKIARKTEVERQHKEFLLSACSEYLSCVMEYSRNKSGDNAKQMMLSMSRLQILCSEKTYELAVTLSEECRKSKQDPARLSDMTVSLVEAMKKEFGK